MNNTVCVESKACRLSSGLRLCAVAVHGSDFQTDLAAFHHAVKVALIVWLRFNVNNSLIDYSHFSNNMDLALRILDTL